MPTSPTTRVLEHLRRSVLPSDAAFGDGELLGCFIERRDEAAIAALITRHGPMVWGVCRRLLSRHDAEDAFQATFLVLVRKAASVAPREMVGNWLYGVAHQTALQARRSAARRSARERQVTEMPDTAAAQPDLWPDLQPVLDEELSRLPDIYRVVIVLCDLEGRTRKEAAGQLGCPEGTVGGRLARARAMLAKRLARRGVVLSGGALATVLPQNAASAGVPSAVVSNTIRAASSVAADSVSVSVAALTEGVLKAMLASKLKAVVAVVLLLGFLTAAVTALSGHLASARENQPPAGEPKAKAPPRPEPEPDRGVAALPDLAGTWQGEDWGTVVLRAAKDGGFEGTYSDTFGKDTGRIAVRWSAVSRRYEGTWSEGTYRFGRIALDAPKNGAVSGAYTTDPKCEHQPGVPSLAGLRWSKKQEKDREKEPFTAWGKEINGLQAGLGFRSGEHRVYHHGETVTIVVRVRNVGKEDVKFQYLKQFFQETPPAVTDGAGKPVALTRVRVSGLIHLPVDVTLAPGKEIELYEWKRELRPAKWLGNDGVPSLYGSGTFGVQYERVFGNSSAGSIKLDPAPAKLATGKLELEVKDAKKLQEKPEQEKEPFTAWGKEVDGVQAGLGYFTGAKRAYEPGETVKLVVRVRNASKKDVKFVYAWESFYEQPPVVTDDAGKQVRFEGVGLSGLLRFKEVTLAPGKQVDLCELHTALHPAGEKDKARPWSLYGTGKFRLQFERVGGNIGTGEIKFDPVLSKLVTGSLELEVKADPPPAAPEKK